MHLRVSHKRLDDTLPEHMAALEGRLREDERGPLTVLKAVGLLPESSAG